MKIPSRNRSFRRRIRFAVLGGILSLLGPAADVPAKTLRHFQLGVWTPAPASTEFKAIRRTLEGFGIPYAAARRVDGLRDRSALIAAGPFSEATLDPGDLQALYRFVEEGGKILLAGEIGPSLFPLTGVNALKPSRKRFGITVPAPPGDAILRYVDEPEEAVWRLGNPALFKEVIWTFAAEPARAKAIAAFDDGTPALLRHDLGLGTVYYLGVGFTESILLPQAGGDFEAQADWINHFEPTTDMFMLLLKAFYRSALSPCFFTGPGPGGARTALLLSHDVDARESFRNAVEFARMERRLGVKSTTFVTTKFFVDASDTAYFNPDNIRHLKTLDSMGFPIGSHSVSHSKIFSRFPFGDPDLAPGAYRPLENPSLLGEIRTSRWLLDSLGFAVSSFRAGELAYHPRLAGALDSSGYSVNSTASANDFLCNFPFLALSKLSVDAPETKVLEIPVTFDCSMGHLTPENQDEMVERWAKIVGQNAGNGAVSTLLIHPNVTDFKLDALEKLIRRLRPEGIWIGDLETYARFHRLRYETPVVDATLSRRTLSLRLGAPRAKIPPAYSLTVSGDALPGKIVVRDLQGLRLQFSSSPVPEGVSLHGFALDRGFYDYQKRLALFIAALFGLVIAVLCAFLAFQRLRSARRALRGWTPERQALARGILNSEQAAGQKIQALGAMPVKSRVRGMLLEQMEVVRGREAAEARDIFRALGFYDQTLRQTRHRRWWRRAQAARALGVMAFPDAEKPLLPLLEDKSEEVRLAAAFALGRLNSPGVIPALFRALEKSDAWTAARLIEFMMPLKQEAGAALVAWLSGPARPPEVEAAALEALGILRELRAVPLLLERLENGPDSLRVAAAGALGAIGDEAVIGPLAIQAEAGGREVQAALVRAAARIGGGKAVALLERLARAPHPAVVREALRALSRLAPSSLANFLAGPGIIQSRVALEIMEEAGEMDLALRAAAGEAGPSRERAEKTLALAGALGAQYIGENRPLPPSGKA